VSPSPRSEALRMRLRAIGLPDDRVEAAATELQARLAALAAVDPARLEGVEPAIVFVSERP
jgi:hypothetical protein